ncbi:Rha family transcriptional regulator [Streptococcus sp. 10F2]
MRRNYSKYINEFCEEYGMSGAQLARMLGVAEDTIQNIRRGKSHPKQSTKDRLNRFILQYKKENSPKHLTQIEEIQKEVLGVDSRTVAEWTNKKHSELMKDIRRYSEYLKKGKIPATDFWQETTYKAENGKVNPCYIVTKKGCEFIQHKMTGEKGALFTSRYIDYFWKQGEELQEATQLLLDLAEEPVGAETSTQGLPTLEQAENNYIDTVAKAIQESSTRAEKVELIERLNKFVSGL